jgi:hypothetical protein
MKDCGMKNYNFFDVTLCSILKVNQHFIGTCQLNLQGWGVSQALLAACFKLVSCLAYTSTLKMEADMFF